MVGSDVQSLTLTGNNNIIIGYGADLLTPVSTNMVLLGYLATTGASSNEAHIGNSSMTKIGGYQNWSNLSDGRFKKNVQEVVPGLEFIKALKPVTYEVDVNALNMHLYGDSLDAEYNNYAIKARQGIVETGFIAQEVETIAKELGYKFNGVNAPQNEKDHYSISYATFVVPLVKAVQEQQTQIEDLKKQLTTQNKLIQQLLEAKE
jgi:hypothetical protein